MKPFFFTYVDQRWEVFKILWQAFWYSFAAYWFCNAILLWIRSRRP